MALDSAVTDRYIHFAVRSAAFVYRSVLKTIFHITVAARRPSHEKASFHQQLVLLILRRRSGPPSVSDSVCEAETSLCSLCLHPHPQPQPQPHPTPTPSNPPRAKRPNKSRNGGLWVLCGDIIADFVLSFTLFHDIMRPACAVLGICCYLFAYLAGWGGVLFLFLLFVWLVGWLVGWLCFRLAIYHLTLCGT